MMQIFQKAVIDIKHLFDSENFSYFSTGGLIGVITFTGLEQYIIDTGLRIFTACLLAFFGGIFGIVGKEVAEKVKKDWKKWRK